MKEQILELRSQGKTYDEIVGVVGCSKGTVSYYCGEGQKEKTLGRQRKRRRNKLIKRVEEFKRKKHKNFVESVRKFNKNIGNSVDSSLDMNFNYQDVLNKFGNITKCYLTGVDINLLEDDYELDHIIPVSRGGLNTLDNLGILSKKANQAKSNLLVNEFIDLCKQVIEYTSVVQSVE